MKYQAWILPLIFVAGLAFGLVHAPYNLPFIGFWALPLAAWLATFTPRKLWAGYLFGLGFFINTMSWISEPFAVGPPEYAWMAYPAWGLMAAGLALFWVPIFAFVKRGYWSVALIFGVMEYLRGHLFTGLPWALLAYGFADAPIAGLASFMGAYGLSAYLVLLPLLFMDYRNMLSLAVAIALTIAGVALLTMRPLPEDMRVAELDARAVQPNFTMEDRWNNSPIVLLRTLIDLSMGDADLVVWPEASIFASPTRDANLLPYIHEALPEQTVILGAPSFDGDIYYNSAYEIRPDGESYRYDKQHLVPFGDYIPFGDWLLEHGIATQTVTTFSARKGKPRPYPDWEGARPNIMICYEGIFPVMARRDGDYIVLITNDIWFGTRSGPYQHLAAARFRAIENGQPLVRSALTGISAIINADGEILSQIGLGERGFVQAKLGAKYENTFYRQFGDWPFILISVLGLAWLLVRKFRINS